MTDDGSALAVVFLFICIFWFIICYDIIIQLKWIFIVGGFIGVGIYLTDFCKW